MLKQDGMGCGLVRRAGGVEGGGRRIRGDYLAPLGSSGSLWLSVSARTPPGLLVPFVRCPSSLPGEGQRREREEEREEEKEEKEPQVSR